MKQLEGRLEKDIQDQWASRYQRYLEENGMSEKHGRVRVLKGFEAFLKDLVGVATHHHANQPGTHNDGDRKGGRNQPNGARTHRRSDHRHQRARDAGANTTGPQQRAPGTGGASTGACPACGGDHVLLPQCAKFRAMTSEQRRQVVKAGNRCFICLRAGHDGRDCTATNCPVDDCGRRHSKWLHERPNAANYRAKPEA